MTEAVETVAGERAAGARAVATRAAGAMAAVETGVAVTEAVETVAGERAAAARAAAQAIGGGWLRVATVLTLGVLTATPQAATSTRLLMAHPTPRPALPANLAPTLCPPVGRWRPLIATGSAWRGWVGGVAT